MNKRLKNNHFLSAALALAAGLVVIPSGYCDPTQAIQPTSTEGIMQSSFDTGVKNYNWHAAQLSTKQEQGLHAQYSKIHVVSMQHKRAHHHA